MKNANPRTTVMKRWLKSVKYVFVDLAVITRYLLLKEVRWYTIIVMAIIFTLIHIFT